MIINVALHNFRSHTHNVVGLPPGVCAISGPVGAGKSSVLNAIGLGLFGYTPTGVTATDWIKHGEKEAVIEITFLARDGRPHTVSQRIPRTGSRKIKILDDSGREIQLGTNRMDEAYDTIRDLFGIDKGENLKDLFSHFIGVPQRELVGVFDLDPAPRAQILDHAFGIESYRLAATTNLSPLKDAATGAVAELEKEQANLEGQALNKPQLEKERDEADEARKTAEAQADELTPKQEKAKTTVAEHETKEKAVTAATTVFDRKQSAHGVVQEREGHAKDRYMEADRAAKFVTAHEARWKKLQAIDEDHSKTDADKRAKDVEARPLRRKKEQVTGREETVRTTKQRANEAEEALKHRPEVVAWEKAGDALEKRAEKVQARRTAFNTAQERFRAEKERIQEFEPAAKQFETLQKKYEVLDPLAKTLKELSEAYAAAQEEATSSKTRLEELQRAVKTLEKGRCPIMPVTCPVVKEDPEKATGNQVLVLRKQDDKAEATVAKAQDAVAKAQKAQDDLNQIKLELAEARRAKREVEQARERQGKAAYDPKEGETLRMDERELKDDQKTHNQVAKEMLRLRSLIDGADDAKQAAKDADAALKSLLEEIKPLAGLEKQVHDLDEKLQTLSKQIQAQASFRDEYKANLTAAAKLEGATATWEIAKKAVTTAVQEMADAKKALQETQRGYDATAHAKAKKLRDELTEHLAAAKSTRDNQREIVKKKLHQLAEINRIEKRLAEITTEVAEAKRTVDFLKDFRGMLLDVGNKMAEHITRGVARHATRYYRSINGNENKELVFGEKYELIVRDGNHETKFRSLSGGEQVSSAVSVRLALIRNVKGFDFAFFDEPTQNMDAQSRRQLAHLLTHAEESFKQLVVISHSDEFDAQTGIVIRLRPSATGSVIA